MTSLTTTAIDTKRAECITDLGKAVRSVSRELENSLGKAVADHLAAGWNFYARLRKDMPKGDPRSPFVTFNGLRFFLDEKVPPNECEIRNRDGIVIGRFKF